jgi:hypothetical protein
LGSRHRVRISAALVVAFGLATAWAGQEQAPGKPGFRLSATMPIATVRAGTSIVVDFALINSSDRYLWLHFVAVPGRVSEESLRLIDVELRDSDGKPIAETEHGKTIHGRVARQPKIAERDKPGVGRGGQSGVDGALPSGETLREVSDLTKEFDLSQPGTYTVRGFRKDGLSGQIVYSNEITFVLLK